MELKLCNKCSVEKPKTHEFFFYKNRAKMIFSSNCRKCQYGYWKDHYKRNSERHIRRSVARKRRVKQAAYRNVFSFLKQHPCVDCGESDPLVLEFDHIDPKSKLSTISRLINNQADAFLIETEMAKCEVRCSNCHRRRTAKQFEWFKYTLS